MATREEILDSNEAELILNSDTLKKSIENLKIKNTFFYDIYTTAFV